MRKFLAGTLVAVMSLVSVGLATPHANAATMTTIEGTVTAVSGTTLPATVTVQSGLTSYTVNVTSTTHLIRKFNGPSDLSELGIADLVQARGVLTGTTLDASWLKNLSIQRRGGEFWGKIVSIDATAKTFVYDITRPGQPDQTVTVSASTKVFLGNRKGSFSSLVVGMTVKVVGLWRKTPATIAADRVMIKLTDVEGKITALDCSATPMTMSVMSKRGKTWTLTLTSTTILRDKKFGAITCADMAVNDKVNVRALETGTLAGTAIQVWDRTKQHKQNTFEGRIKSVDATTMTFMLDKKNSSTDYTVSVTGATILVNDDGTVITFASLAVGNKVTIKGSQVGTAITGNLVIDRSLP